MEQRKDSRIRRLLKKEVLQDQGDKRMEQRKVSRIRPSMHKKNKKEKDSRIRWRCVKRTQGSGGNKNGAEKRFQDQAVAAERKTPGSGGKKSGVEKIFQDQAVNKEKRTKQNK
jgi:hypothetical protein